MTNNQNKTSKTPSSSVETETGRPRVPPLKALMFLVTFVALASYTTLAAWGG